MNRRELMLILSGASVAIPLAAGAQEKTMPVIGFLGGATLGTNASVVAAFRLGLSETGYAEGQNVVIDFRWAERRYDRLPSLAADLVARKVDLIAAFDIASARAAKRETRSIPIVFVVGGDPVAAGLVTNLPRPDGNLTGVSFVSTELMPKRLQLLCELAPQAKVFALLVNPNSPNTELMMRNVPDIARAKGLAAAYSQGQFRRRD
jgi:putative ABC transport system substrate-binding protein